MSGASGERDTQALIFFYFIVGISTAIDQLTKHFALSHLPQYDTIPIIENFFHLTLVRNTGIAFGLFRDHQSVLLVLISLSLVILFFWVRSTKDMGPLPRNAMGLILGGALGNWIDRVRWGAVIDFLDFRIWPVFNLADSFITVGVGLYIIALLRETKKGSAQSS